MKKITDLKRIKGDAYDYYLSRDSDTDLFNKIFMVDSLIDEIKKPDKFFLIVSVN